MNGRINDAPAPAAELAARRNRVISGLPSAKLDCVLIAALPNVRYLTGFTGSNALAVLHASGTILFTDPRYIAQAAHETACEVRLSEKSLYKGAHQYIRRKRWRRVGFEKNRISFGAHAELKEGLSGKARLEPVVNLVEEHRMIKSEWEIEAVRLSVLLNSQAFSAALANLRPEMTERDLAAELEYQLRLHGADRAAFDTIVASGLRSAFPHARPTGLPLEADQLLLIDMGAMRNGYASDMTRVVHLGRISSEKRQFYNAVLQAQQAAIAAVRPGVKASQVDQAARDTLKAHGLDQLFAHSTGHGLGLEIHEPP